MQPTQQRSRSIGINMTEGSVVKQMFRFALPMMLATALQQVYGLVDTVVVGQMIGSVGLSSVAVASQVIAFMTSLCMGFSMGAQIVIAQHVGAKRHEDLRAIIGNTFFIHMVFAVVLAIVGIVFCNPILKALNTPEAAFEGAASYLIISCAGLIFVFGYNMVSTVLRGLGNSKHPLLFVAIASCINVVLDILFVGPMKMGAAGAALATILSQAGSFVFALIFLYRHRDSFYFDFKLKSCRPVKSVLAKICKLGLPQGFQMAAIQISMMFVSSNINSFGVAASAAYSVGNKVEHIPSICTQGLSNAVSAMVAQNFGAGKFDRIRTTTRTALITGTAVLSVFAAVYLIFPEAVFRLFTQDETVLVLARTVLTGFVIGYPATILMNAYIGVIKGVGNAMLGMCLGLLDGVVLRIGLSYLFGTVLDMGLAGFVLGYSCAIYGMGVPAAIYYYSGKWKKRKSLVH